MEPNETLVELAQALADPLRLQILQHLMEGPATVSELLSMTGEAQSKISNHLAILRERELVSTQREGRQVVYSLRGAVVAQLVESLTCRRRKDATKDLEIATPDRGSDLLRSSGRSLWSGLARRLSQAFSLADSHCASG